MNIIKLCQFTIVLTLTSCNSGEKGFLHYVEGTPEKGFNFPYYLYVPENCANTDTLVHLIIEPNNSGFVDDDLAPHSEKARRIATKDFYIGNFIARRLHYPLLVPVFPRSESNWQVYTHALDRDAMTLKGTAEERIDHQLIKMAKDAQGKLMEMGIKSGEQYILTGFSASGTFVNRFTLLHPQLVLAVAAGGLNGVLMLPYTEKKGFSLKYPVGVGDYAEFSDSPFQLNTFCDIPQFYFMGALDTNDAVPYRDAYDDDEREMIYAILGREMQPERWETSQRLYQNICSGTIFKTYENKGHEHPETIKNEISDFIKNVIEDRSRFGHIR